MINEEKDKILSHLDDLIKKCDYLFICFDTLFTNWVAQKEEAKDFFDLYSSYVELSQCLSELLILLEV